MTSTRASSLATKLVTRAIMHVGAPVAAGVSRTSVRRQAALGGRFSPIFIIGPPRCGSTILYQALSNYLDVQYIDNLAARWGRSLYFGVGRSMKRFGRAPHENFAAELGSTLAAGGWHAPSECAALWYRWIPFDQHYVSPDEVTPAMIDGLRSELQAIQNRWQRPLLIKNLHVGQRIAWTRQAFPEAKYICIHRSKADVVASILAARHSLRVPADAVWSTRPKRVDDLALLPEPDLVAAQVDRLTMQMEDDLGELSRSAVRHVDYSDFSAELIADLASWLELRIRPGGSLPDFRGYGGK